MDKGRIGPMEWWKNVKVLAISSTEGHVCITFDDGKTFVERVYRVIDGNLVLQVDTEEKIG